jgi:hypothetical protein
MSGIGPIEDQHSRSVSFLEAENHVSKTSSVPRVPHVNIHTCKTVVPVSDSLRPLLSLETPAEPHKD